MKGRYTEAERLSYRAILIREKATSPDHQSLVLPLENRARLLRSQVRTAFLSGNSEKRHAVPRVSCNGVQIGGLKYILSIVTIDPCFAGQGKFEEADSLHRRIVSILSINVGEEHPQYASALLSRAVLLRECVSVF